MHRALEEIPYHVLENAKIALIQANTHAVFLDPGNEHWGNVSVLNASRAGELFIKAAIAAQHPLLIFQNIFDFDDGVSDEIDIERVLTRARTHDFQHLPKILWTVLGERIPDLDSFERIRSMRNAIQHFYHPAGLDNYGQEASNLSLEFIYKNIDPIINKHFGLHAIEFHEDHSVGYDYVVASLLRRQIKFTVPHDFSVSEISIYEESSSSSSEYRNWVESNLL